MDFLAGFLSKLYIWAGFLDRLHSDDPVCACGFLHCRGLHPDDCVGQRQTPQLLKGVQRLSYLTLLHTPLHPLEPGREKQLLHTSSLPPAPPLSLTDQAPPSIGLSECVCWGWHHGWILVTRVSCTVILPYMSLCNKQRRLQLLWVLDWWMQDCYRQRKPSELNLNAAKS